MFELNENSGAPALKAAGFILAPELLLKSQGDTAGGTPDIRALTVAIRRGDAAAFSQFYDLYSFRIYRFLLVLARGDEQEAREVCQLVLTKLVKRLQVFDDEGKLWAWLCVLAKNTFIDQYRSRQRRDRLLPLEELPVDFGLDGDATHHLSESLRNALAAMTPEERELIQAAYVDERPLQELAAGSGQTYKAVESRLARLRKKLKEQILHHMRHENKS